MLRKRFAWGALALVTACGSGAADNLAPLEQHVGTSTLDVISSANCKLQNGKLRQCVVPVTTLSPVTFDTAVPLRTVLTVNKSGNCTTVYDLKIAAALDGASPASLRYFNQNRLELTRPDGAAAASVVIRDDSPFTGAAIVDQSCLVTLTVSTNEPDVDSAAEATAILAALEAQLDAKRHERDDFEALVALSNGFAFLQSVTGAFYTELTNETMQELRESARTAGPAFETLLLGCSDGISEEDQMQLFRLYVALAGVGDAADWRNPDGTTKTLADFLGPNATAVFASIEHLRDRLGGDPGTVYQAKYEAAALEVTALEGKVALAKVQLEPWLPVQP
jgi:hypothetical protein